ncbi:uncharacterized protein LOC18435993 [Amborella trichopoda]|uniref:Uncharacterized protein n=1 Tax=Amborella trichopoda TaxID=13333 RepID=W1PIE4_AMBTC|nr:uncharacterized protein LOC18435993 [Amborella trichopoda]ERN07763.1 hypothetical protein AMTR_s00012p00097440 [Amborella trichopoda]|eukprot:XP_006846088.1 uncharacterized protein LOC18435993 [Amborella trichopoda]
MAEDLFSYKTCGARPKLGKIAEDVEKRFENVMNKLSTSKCSFGTTPTSMAKSASSMPETPLEANPVGLQLHSRSSKDALNGASSPPLCRPWDRGDFLRRLSTFKAVTWFAKPKIVNPVNCARRGWINVERDTIACEACGARLLFCTPSSWTPQQDEKAAAVFSLKLDHGHKPLCPWKDNICEESLAHFPRVPVPTLIKSYRKRFDALAHLSSLPIVSSSAIDCMRDPQLDIFLSQSPPLEKSTSEYGSTAPGGVDFVDHSEAASADLYYKAQKIISLCGWEPRVLPYVIECEDHPSLPSKCPSPSQRSQCLLQVQTPTILLNSKSGDDEAAVLKESNTSFKEKEYDPASVVLDCKLCGASIALWTFSTVPQPLQSFNLIEQVEVHGIDSRCSTIACYISNASGVEGASNEHRIANCEIFHDDSAKEISTKQNDRNPSLNLSIAGGPLPTKQKFHVTVSLPIMTRHLLAGSNSERRNWALLPLPQEQQDYMQSTAHDINSAQCRNKHDQHYVHGQQGERVATGGMSKRRRSEEASLPTNHLDPISLDEKFSEVNDTPMDKTFSSEGESSKKQRQSSVNAIGACHTVIENSTESVENRPQDSFESGVIFEGSRANDLGLEVGERNFANGLPTSSTKGAEIDNELPKPSSNGCHQSDEIIPANNEKQHKSSIEDGQPALSKIPTCLVTSTPLIAFNGVSCENKVTSDSVAALGSGTNKEFDPIKHHRYYCPWITSSGNSDTGLAGWQQTLSALLKSEEAATHDSPMSPASTSLRYEVDPVASIRKLFQSPSSKRMKSA